MSKPWYKSATIYALAVSLLAHVLVLMGAGEGTATELANNFVTALIPIVGIVADAVGAWGRSRATGPLTAKENPMRLRLPPVALLGAVAVSWLVIGCTGLGLEAPQSFTERLAYGYATHTAVMDSTTHALEAGEISSSEAAEVAEIGDNARELLDSARAVHDAGRVPAAQRQLVLALALLTELQRYIQRE